MNPAEVLALAARLQREGEGFVLCTVVQATGSTPGRPGFKMVVRESGELHGTVGGGQLERDVVERARKLMQTGGAEMFTATLTVEADGMACGGQIMVFCEHMAPARRAFLFGAGHLCQSLAPILRSIGFHVVALDDRPNIATPQRVPQAHAHHTVRYAEYAASFSPAPQDAIAIFTHGHSGDRDILRALCARQVQCTYIGMIGSRRKVAATFDALRQEMPHAEEWLQQVHAPIGLNVAHTTTSEIAVAIAAEMLAVYNGVGEVRESRE